MQVMPQDEPGEEPGALPARGLGPESLEVLRDLQNVRNVRNQLCIGPAAGLNDFLPCRGDWACAGLLERAERAGPIVQRARP
jgi:hypothetical protein